MVKKKTFQVYVKKLKYNKKHLKLKKGNKINIIIWKKNIKYIKAVLKVLI